MLGHHLPPHRGGGASESRRAEGTVLEVTDRKLREEELRRVAEFEQQFVGIISHDLRNPLGAIQLSADVLARSPKLDPAAARSVARIRSSADRAARLITNLLDFAEARLGGGLPVNPRPETYLHRITRALLDEVQLTAGDREIDYRSSGVAVGEWDPDRLGQVVQNLVTNALRYSPEQSPVVVRTIGLDDEAVQHPAFGEE